MVWGVLTWSSLVRSAPVNRVGTADAGHAQAAGSASTRWAVFHAGMESTEDPKYTVVPQRQRRDARGGGEAIQ